MGIKLIWTKPSFAGRNAGLEDILGVFIDIDDSFEGQVERMDKDEFEKTLNKFNSFLLLS